MFRDFRGRSRGVGECRPDPALSEAGPVASKNIEGSQTDPATLEAGPTTLQRFQDRSNGVKTRSDNVGGTSEDLG